MLLPTYQGTLEAYKLTGNPLLPRAPRTALTRTAFAAAHVVSDPLKDRSDTHTYRSKPQSRRPCTPHRSGSG